ncbi:MAG: polysaccharide biosynthesis/export family protein [Deltaproteobacteria bacterium]|nr:polysaccharide biosynthesis/export family protein [Deltaproteobacteria bacterium]
MPKIKSMAVYIFFVALISIIFISKDISIAAADSPDYTIGPNDTLSIFVWKEPDLTRDVTVMSDGKISFPLIGNIVAQGKTVAQLRDTITKKLKYFIDSPEVTVIVNESHQLIYVIGNVNQQSPIPLQANMTVLQALSTAGGFSQWADQKNIIIVRREGGKEIQISFNYKELVSGKKVEQNIVLQPNDTIVVP